MSIALSNLNFYLRSKNSVNFSVLSWSKRQCCPSVISGKEWGKGKLDSPVLWSGNHCEPLLLCLKCDELQEYQKEVIVFIEKNDFSEAK